MIALLMLCSAVCQPMMNKTTILIGTCITGDLMANGGGIIVIWSTKNSIAPASQPLNVTTKRIVLQFDLPLANIKSIILTPQIRSPYLALLGTRKK